MRLTGFTPYCILLLARLVLHASGRALSAEPEKHNLPEENVSALLGVEPKILEYWHAQEVSCRKGHTSSKRDLGARQTSPAQLLFDKLAFEVQMGSCNYLRWDQLDYGIGTIGLCGCSVIAIFGKYGALLAHFLPSRQDGFMADQLDALHRNFAAYFIGQPASDIHAILLPPAEAELGVEVLPPLGDYIQAFIEENMGLQVARFTYTMRPEGSGLDGTALLRNLAGVGVQLWVDNHLLWRYIGEK